MNALLDNKKATEFDKLLASSFKCFIKGEESVVKLGRYNGIGIHTLKLDVRGWDCSSYFPWSDNNTTLTLPARTITIHVKD